MSQFRCMYKVANYAYAKCNISMRTRDKLIFKQVFCSVYCPLFFFFFCYVTLD